jgi:hypothetical protein
MDTPVTLINAIDVPALTVEDAMAANKRMRSALKHILFEVRENEANRGGGRIRHEMFRNMVKILTLHGLGV